MDQLFKWRNNPLIYNWCRQREPLTVESHGAWYESLSNRDDVKMYGICRDVDLIGVCGLTDIDLINSRAEFSLYIGPEHHGKGYAQLALRNLMRVAFYVYNLNLVWGESFFGNHATNIFEKVGFKFEGMRRSFYYRNGKYLDASLWSLLRDEFIDPQHTPDFSSVLLNKAEVKIV